jgi:FtsP/CotA-like multicopper oxidase with cupredoxin domain
MHTRTHHGRAARTNSGACRRQFDRKVNCNDDATQDATISCGTVRARPTALAAVVTFMALIATMFSANPALAGAGWGDTTNPSPDPAISTLDSTKALKVRTYYANSPQGVQADALDPTLTRDTGLPLRKFIDGLPGVGATAGSVGAAGSGTNGTYIPVAAPDTMTYADANYYEIAVVEYTQRMHTDLLKATTLRGYVQIDPVATDVAAGIPNVSAPPAGSKAIALFQLDGITPVLISRASATSVTVNGVTQAPVNGFVQVPAYAVDKPAFLGPIIIAVQGKPTRLKFYNGLPNGRGYTDAAGFHRQGDLFIPVDHTLFGGGDGPVQIGAKDLPCGDTIVGPNNAPDSTFTGCAGSTDPVTGHVTPAGFVSVPAFAQYTENREELHLHGGDNPWISDGHPHQWIVPALDELGRAGPGGDVLEPSMRRGESAVNVPDMPDPGPGAATYYWPNGQSGRLLFYHDHATGLTRLNVYAGTAAGYVLVDGTENAMMRGILGTADPVAAEGIPLVIQDKTFVPKDIATQDAKWDSVHWGQEGDLWFPHVYETNQDPLSADATNPVGRWDGASFFWPVFPQNYLTPSGGYGDVSTTPESFMDTPIVNGMAYPTVTVDPKAYRFRILSVPNDRMTNLSLFVADSTVTGASGIKNTEVKMVPFSSPNGPTQVTYSCPDGVAGGPGAIGTVNANGTITKAGWTESGLNSAKLTLYSTSFPCAGGLIGTGWGQADNRPGGVPDPANVGPDIIRIGNEGGLFQQAVVIPATAINYEYNKRSVTVLNVLERSLWLGPAERADVIIDFSAYAGKTLILYNDSGAPVPAGDPRIDYYTGDGDQTGAGGAPDTAPGYGPNTRTIMQIIVSTTKAAAPFDVGVLNTQLLAAYKATQPLPVVPTPEYAPLLGAAANAPYEHIYTGAIYLNKYNAITFNAADVFNYTPAPTCNTTASCNTALAAIRKTSYGAGLPIGNKQSTVNGAVSAYVESKAIQELFEADYGRMNAILGVELPFTNVNIQTTIPLAYVDPATETIANGETQFWKITHNGVDSHPVHFHFINVQVINRVGWDGTIKPIPADEVGWKETVKMHPLEDIIVAVRAKSAPPTPFGMPHSFRRPAPNQLATDNHGITQIDPITGNAPTTPYTNAPVDYGSEYVWHCHILGHEENDFMRPFIFNAKEVLAPSFTITSAAAGASGVAVTWVDPTPIPKVLSTYDPITSVGGFLGNPNNEIGFRVERASVDAAGVIGAYAPVGAGLHKLNAITGQVNEQANATSYVDTSAAGGSALAAPAAPAIVSQTAASVTLSLQPLTLIAGATGYDVYRNNVQIASNQPAGNFVDSGVTAGNSYSYTVITVASGATRFSYRVVAVTAAGERISSNVQLVTAPGASNSVPSAPTTVVMAPAVIAGVTVTNPTVSSLQVNWPAAPAAQVVKSYLVSRNGAPGLAATSPDVVTGLAANTSYSFTVAAVNASGTGAASAPTTGLTLPAAPTVLTMGTIGSTTVALSWTAPANSAGLSYTVTVTPAAGTVSYNGTTALVSGLGPNRTYTFTVAANNASGASAASNAVTALTLPVAPTNLSAAAASNSSVTLAWTASVNGAASYTVQYSANNGANWTNLAPLVGTGTTVTGLTPSTTYLFQVYAANATGSSAPSGQASATTPAATVAPGIPTCCTATLPTSTSVVLNWIAPATGPATSYTVQRATNATFTRGLQTVLNVIGTNLPFTGLNSNTTYYFHVLATNSVGSSVYSATFSFQPPAPPATPAAPGAVASPISTSAPTISLTLPAPAAGVTYTVYQQSRTGFGGAWSAATAVATGVTGTTWTSAAVTPTMQYRFYLVAVNAAGTSANGPTSATVTPRELANAPVGPSATAATTGVTAGVGTRQVTVTWSLGAANGSTVTGIRVLRNATGTQGAPTAGQTNGVLTGGVTTTNVGATAVTTTVGGLARNTTYYFQVQEVTAGGTNQSVVVSVTTAP